MLNPLFSCEWVRFGLLILLPIPAVGLRFILKFIFSITLGEDPACWTPCSRVNEWDLASLYPCWCWRWGWDSLWNLFFHECGWRSSMLDPLFSCEWVRFGLVILLPIPAVGLRFILKFIFSITLGEDPACWTPCSRVNEWDLALLYPCRYRQWVRDRFWIFFFINVGEDPACWTPCSCVSEWDLASLYPYRY
jgi:hypothetical protein